MKAVGIITEFNPFHNGHKYILNKAKEASGADCVICVMSGHFVQRGEGSIYSKWARAKTALHNGADLVIELPVIYSLQSAENFAFGGISLLKALSVDAVAFGTEESNPDALFQTATLLTDSENEYLVALKEALDRGECYAFAQAEAMKKISAPLTLSPNNILALSYLNAAKEIDFTPVWFPIERIGVAHDKIGTGSYSSASHIRELLGENELEEVKSFVPYTPSFPELDREFLETLTLANLRKMSPEDLAEISGVSEGLENRILSAANAPTFESFLKDCATKRYPVSRIRRIAGCALLGITKELAKKEPEYLRVLGMSEAGQQYLKEKKESFTLPLVVKTADAPHSELLEKDILATNLWALATHNKKGMADFYHSPIIIKKGENR